MRFLSNGLLNQSKVQRLVASHLCISTAAPRVTKLKKKKQLTMIGDLTHLELLKQ